MGEQVKTYQSKASSYFWKSLSDVDFLASKDIRSDFRMGIVLCVIPVTSNSRIFETMLVVQDKWSQILLSSDIETVP